MSVNKVILVGNVGKDPETRYLDESTAITKFPMATSETYKNRNGERVSNTEWHNIVLWRGLAQVAEKYVKKGTQIYIEGRIKTRSYDDAEGNRKYITEVVGDQMQMLGRRPDDGQSSDASSRYGSNDEGAGSQSSNSAGQSSAASGSSSAADGSSSSSGSQPNSSGSQPNSSGNQPNNSGNQGYSAPGSDQDAPFDSGDEGPDDLPF
jgi:single-strand DNA-binding protein